MKQVKVIAYLGSVLTSNRRCLNDIERRRAGAIRAFGMLTQRRWGRKEISLKVKLKVFNGIVIPVLM